MTLCLGNTLETQLIAFIIMTFSLSQTNFGDQVINDMGALSFFFSFTSVDTKLYFYIEYLLIKKEYS